MADRNARGDVRQRREFQRLNEEVAGLTARIAELEGQAAANGVPVDAETPSGTINGSNAAFGLAHTPMGESLMLFRNGLLLTAGASADYTLSGSTITFNAGEEPDTGATLQAFYRRAST